MPRAPWRVHVADVLRTGTSRDVRIEAPLGETVRVTGSHLPPDADVVAELRIDQAGSAVAVSGRVTMPWVGECRRCLREVHGELTVAVRETFEKDHEEGETYPLEGSQVDIEPLVREAVLPELPQVPLCREDCAGLCPECGADRNEGPCGHEGGPVDPRWGALDQLRDN